MGARVGPGAAIAVDGTPVTPVWGRARYRVILYHKPEGEVCTRSDPQGRPTVFGRLPTLKAGRWISVGRLDINTSGLLLLTNNGDLANTLMHPRYGIEREYVARVSGALTRFQRQRLTRGVPLDGVPAQFTEIHEQRSSGGINRWYRVVITEGRNREVRRLFNAAGASVNRLKRIRFGPVRLPADLRPGSWRYLDDPTLRRLLDNGADET